MAIQIQGPQLGKTSQTRQALISEPSPATRQIENLQRLGAVQEFQLFPGHRRRVAQIQFSQREVLDKFNDRRNFLRRGQTLYPKDLQAL